VLNKKYTIMNTQTIDQRKLEQEKIRKQIAALVDQYAAIEFSPKAFEPGQTVVPPSGKLIGSEELKNGGCILGWLAYHWSFQRAI
jgi:CDP-4-dehydro-6-deoxyglucose reductase, E1